MIRTTCTLLFVSVVMSAWLSEAIAVNDDAPALNSPGYWISGFFSEEQGHVSCPKGHALKGIECQGRYCDNKRLYCWPLSTLSANNVSEISSKWFSEESYSQRNRLLDNYHTSGGFLPVTGLGCRGRYCDDLQLKYAVGAVINTGYCQQSPFFSEETHERSGIGNIYVCPRSNGYVAGVACQGRYCDNISLYCCEQDQ